MPRYNDEYRASAVLMLEAAGYPEKTGALTAVSKRLGVSHQTLGRWFRKESNPPPSKIVHEKRINLVEEIENLIGLTIDAAKNEVTEANYRELITGLGILVDKKQLLSGQPTERTETKGEYKITDVDSDNRAAVVGEVERILKRTKSGASPTIAA